LLDGNPGPSFALVLKMYKASTKVRRFGSE
jgi:hypothetical protein